MYLGAHLAATKNLSIVHWAKNIFKAFTTLTRSLDYGLPGPLNFNEPEPFKGGTEINFSCETIKMLMGFLL